MAFWEKVIALWRSRMPATKPPMTILVDQALLPSDTDTPSHMNSALRTHGAAYKSNVRNAITSPSLNCEARIDLPSDGTDTSFVSPPLGPDCFDAESSRNLSILELVRQQPTSVRLRNCIEKAEFTGTLPFRTVGDYRDAGAEAIPRLLTSVNNFGRKTAAELDDLVRYSRDTANSSVEPGPRVRIDRDALKKSLLRLFETIETGPAMAGQAVPKRLSNALILSGYASRPLSGILGNLETINQDIPRMLNVGRTSLNAWNDALATVVDTQLARHGLALESVREAREFLLDSRDLSDDAAEALFRQLDDIASCPSPLGTALQVPAHPEIILRESIGALGAPSEKG